MQYDHLDEILLFVFLDFSVTLYTTSYSLRKICHKGTALKFSWLTEGKTSEACPHHPLSGLLPDRGVRRQGEQHSVCQQCRCAGGCSSPFLPNLLMVPCHVPLKTREQIRLEGASSVVVLRSQPSALNAAQLASSCMCQ